MAAPSGEDYHDYYDYLLERQPDQNRRPPHEDEEKEKNKEVEEEEVRLLVAQRFLTEDFPSCARQIARHTACLRRRRALHQHRHLRSTPAGAGSSGQQEEHEHEEHSCASTEALMTYCIVGSFCPKEAAQLQECLEGRVPNLTSTPLPPRAAGRLVVDRVPAACRWRWKKLDGCLQRSTASFGSSSSSHQRQHARGHVDSSSSS